MYPPIHNAAYRGEIDNLRAELDKGVSPDLAYIEEWSHHDETGAITMTPLHYLLHGARAPNALSCLDLLLAAGANPNFEQLGDFGCVEPGVSRTPLAIASRNQSRGRAN